MKIRRKYGLRRQEKKEEINPRGSLRGAFGCGKLLKKESIKPIDKR